MSDSDRGTRDQAVAAVFVAAAITLLVTLIYAVGDLSGRQSERRETQPHSHYQAAKEQAERACVGVRPAAMLECVYDTIEASEETARSEQDLTAQQRAAWAAMLGAGVAFLALGATVVGLYYVRETLRATLKAVEDTGNATVEMRKANEISNRIAEAELRPYLFVESLNLVEVMDEMQKVQGDDETKEVPGIFYARVEVHFRNYGKVPARNIRVFKRRYLARFHRGRIYHFRSGRIAVPVCAPGHERRIFDAIVIGPGERADFDEGNLIYVLRLRYWYEDDRGTPFTDCADYHLSGDNLTTFYLLLGPHRIKHAREDWEEWQLMYGDEEGEPAEEGKLL